MLNILADDIVDIFDFDLDGDPDILKIEELMKNLGEKEEL